MDTKRKITIRQETAADHDAVLVMVRDAFWNMYQPGCDEHFLVHQMNSHKDTIPELILVAVDKNDNKTILGYVGGTRATIGGDTEVVTLAPLAVSRTCHNKGVGSRLVEAFVEKAKSLGYPCVCIQGYPSYYERFGTANAQEFGIHLPDKTQPYGFQIIPLVAPSGMPKGAYVESKVFQNVPSKKIIAFEAEKSFPFKEKKEGTRSQEMFAMIYPLSYGDEVPPEFDSKACNDTS